MGNFRKFTKAELKWIDEFKSLMKKPACKNLFMLVDDSIKIYPERKVEKEFGSYIQGELDEYFLIQTRMLTDGGDY